MPGEPYEQTFRQRSELCFFAAVPALAHIGERFEQLSDAIFHYQAPEDQQVQWRQLVRRLHELLEYAKRGSLRPWSLIQKQLDQEFQEAFRQACGRVSPYVQEYFDTGQMPLAEYLEWVINGAETMWSLNGGQGLDMDQFQARVDQLVQRLQSSGYESAMDRQLRDEDPQRYEFLAKSMHLALEAMSDPDPNAHERMIAQQIDLFRQSPMFEQGQNMMREWQQRLGSMRDTNPELYEQQMRGLERLEQLRTDPSAERQVMRVTESDETASTPDKDETPQVTSSPGQLLFSGGRCEAFDTEQIALFEDFIEQAEALRPAIERALRDMHRWMQPAEPIAWPGDQVLFPVNPDESDVPLQCFRIRRATLQRKSGGRIVLDLDSQFGHFDEHGCSLLIRNGSLERYGTWDDVFADDELEDNAG